MGLSKNSDARQARHRRRESAGERSAGERSNESQNSSYEFMQKLMQLSANGRKSDALRRGFTTSPSHARDDGSYGSADAHDSAIESWYKNDQNYSERLRHLATMSHDVVNEFNANGERAPAANTDLADQRKDTDLQQSEALDVRLDKGLRHSNHTTDACRRAHARNSQADSSDCVFVQSPNQNGAASQPTQSTVIRTQSVLDLSNSGRKSGDGQGGKDSRHSCRACAKSFKFESNLRVHLAECQRKSEADIKSELCDPDESLPHSLGDTPRCSSMSSSDSDGRLPEVTSYLCFGSAAEVARDNAAIRSTLAKRHYSDDVRGGVSRHSTGVRNGSISEMDVPSKRAALRRLSAPIPMLVSSQSSRPQCNSQAQTVSPSSVPPALLPVGRPRANAEDAARRYQLSQNLRRYIELSTDAVGKSVTSSSFVTSEPARGESERQTVYRDMFQKYAAGRESTNSAVSQMGLRLAPANGQVQGYAAPDRRAGTLDGGDAAGDKTFKSGAAAFGESALKGN